MKPTIAISVNSSWNIVNFRSGLVRGLIDAGYDVIAIAPADEHSERVRQLGCRLIPIRMVRRGTSPVQDIGLVLQYLRILRRERPAAFLGFTIKPNIYGSIAAHLLGIPTVNNIAGLGVTFLKNGLLQKLVRVLYKVALSRSRRVFFQNREDLSLFVAEKLVAEERAMLLPGSGVDLSRFAPVPRSTAPDRDFVFLLSARLLRTKGIGEFVQAAESVRRSHPNSKFRIAGIVEDMHPDAISESEIANWRNGSAVEYLGTLGDVRGAIADADVVVLPTFYPEGTPRALLEGAAMAKPLITTDVPGCRDIVVQGLNGVLCAPRDPEALAQAMRRMMDLPLSQLEEMGRASRRRAIECYDENIVLRQYVEILEELLPNEQQQALAA
jgi:glycosyltransferase involved in cell wall biosynthesis